VGKRKALLIGVSDYKSSSIGALPCVRNDLTILQTALQKSRYDVEVIGFDGESETGTSNLCSQIGKACENAKDIETLLLYLSGHGIHYNGKDYLVASDAVIDNPRLLERGLGLVPIDLSEIVNTFPAAMILLVVDACREGIKLEAKSLGLASWTRGERRLAAQQNLAVIFSCKQGEFSYYTPGDQGFSLFTRAFSDVIDPDHPACSLSDILGATQERLTELSLIHGKPPQEIRICHECSVGEREQLRVICEGEELALSDGEEKSQKQSKRIFQLLEMPPLPRHFVARPEYSEELTRLLLQEEKSLPGTLVVSAIYGLGGIGKSVLAAALAHDTRVQQRFEDGILWVTLGQEPDIQKILGDWIQKLRDFDYKPTTIEAASAHLRTLLHGKRMLLVVDDVWQANHLEPFRVGGQECRVLVTTREAFISDAEHYDLDVMSETQSVALLEGCIKRTLVKGERADAVSFAKAVGFLPLALELAAVQVGEGFAWKELLEEFKQEITKLELLDSPEALPGLSDEQLRKHSLRACFNLSLRRLSPELLQQFAWLGVLPEDVEIASKMAETLWGVSPFQAKKVLQALKNKAFLTPGPVSASQQPTYRLHDLMHDTARWLITQPQDSELSGWGLTLPLAHQLLLERYQEKTKNGLWYTLEDDGYIRAYLTWHLEKAECFSELHQLFQEKTPEGRNGWYEACDRLGQTAIFVSDLARAWRLVEERHKEDLSMSQSISLQIRYALIFSSLNSLATNIPAKLMAALVEKKVWTPAQGAAYAQQAQTADQRAEIICALAPFSPQSLLLEMLKLAQWIQDASKRASALTGLVPYLPQIASEALDTVREIINESNRAFALVGLVPYLPENLMSEALEIVREIKDEPKRVYALNGVWRLEGLVVDECMRTSEFTGLMSYLPKKLMFKALEVVREIKDEPKRASAFAGLVPYFSEPALALEAVREIKDESERASALAGLAPHLPQIASEALDTVREITNEFYRASALAKLAPHLPENLMSKTLEIVREIKDESDRASALTGLVPYLPQIASEALDTVREIINESDRVSALAGLTPHLPENLMSKALEIVREIQDASKRASALVGLVPHLPQIASEALDTVREITNEFYRAPALAKLAPHLPENLMSKTLEMVREIKDESDRASALTGLVPYLPQIASEALDTVREIINKSDRVSALAGLIPHLPENLMSKALEIVREIKDESKRASVLSELAPHLSKNLMPKALRLVREIKDESKRTSVLTELATHLPKNLMSEALEVVREINDEYCQANTLRGLVQYFPEIALDVLDIARSIKDESARINALSGLVLHLPVIAPAVLEVVRKTNDKYYRASALIKLVPHLPELTSEALETVGEIQNEYHRTSELDRLVSHLPVNLMSNALKIVRKIKDEYYRTSAFTRLVPFLPENLMSEALEIAREIQDEYYQIPALNLIVLYLPDNLMSEALEIIRKIQDGYYRASALTKLVPCLPQIASEALEVVKEFQDEYYRASALTRLVPHLPELILEALETVGEIQDESKRVSALAGLIPHLPENLMSKALEMVKEIKDEYCRTFALTGLVPHLSENIMSRALEAVREIKDECRRASVFTVLVPRSPELVLEALETLQGMQYSSDRTSFFCELIPYVPEMLHPEILEIAREIQDEADCVKALRGLVPYLSEPLLSEMLEIVSSLQDESLRACVLSDLLPYLSGNSQLRALEAVRQVQDKFTLAYTLNSVIPYLPEIVSEVLEVVQGIQDEDFRLRIFDDLMAQLDLMSMDFSLWSKILHELAFLGRKNFLKNLSRLGFVAMRLGGRDALRELSWEIRDVGLQWK
jgi:NB-ARC domain/Caspase domain